MPSVRPIPDHVETDTEGRVAWARAARVRAVRAAGRVRRAQSYLGDAQRRAAEARRVAEARRPQQRTGPGPEDR